MTIQQRWMLVAVVVFAGLFIYFLEPVLAPFTISMVLAYFGDSLADRLEKLGISRTGAVILVFLIIFTVVGAVLLIVVPLAFQQLKVSPQNRPTPY